MLNTKAPQGGMVTTFNRLVADAYEVKRRQHAAYLQQKAARANRLALRLLSLLLLISLLLSGYALYSQPAGSMDREYAQPRYTVLHWGPSAD